MKRYFLDVELRGVGTRDVEAMGSYIHRLSYLHTVSAGRLLEHAAKFYHWHTNTKANDWPRIGSNGNIAALVRPNNYTQYVYNVISHVTGNEFIRSGTFLSLTLALDRSVRTFSARLRWCPVCMYEFEKDDDPGYFKLLWHISQISLCLDHMVQLIEECPHCGSHQDGYGFKNICRECQRCGGSLGFISKPVKGITRAQYIDIDLVHLVEYIAKNPDLMFPENGFRDLMEDISHSVHSHNGNDREWFGIPRRDWLKITNGNTSVTIDVTRRFAFILGVGIVDLLLGQLNYTSRLLRDNWFQELPEYLRPKNKSKRHKKDEIEKYIYSYIFVGRFDADPMPLSRVAKMANVSRGYIEYHFPKLARLICQTYKESKKAELARKRKQAHEAAYEFFCMPVSSCSRRSRKDALRQLREKTGLPKNILREEIKKVYADIIWNAN